MRRTLKNIALTTVRNVIDLKRNLDSTYKNEPNYQIKKVKLQRLGEKLKNIIQLINKCENAIDKDQLLFFRKAMDAQMRAIGERREVATHRLLPQPHGDTAANRSLPQHDRIPKSNLRESTQAEVS